MRRNMTAPTSDNANTKEENPLVAHPAAPADGPKDTQSTEFMVPRLDADGNIQLIKAYIC